MTNYTNQTCEFEIYGVPLTVVFDVDDGVIDVTEVLAGGVDIYVMLDSSVFGAIYKKLKEKKRDNEV